MTACAYYPALVASEGFDGRLPRAGDARLGEAMIAAYGALARDEREVAAVAGRLARLVSAWRRGTPPAGDDLDAVLTAAVRLGLLHESDL